MNPSPPFPSLDLNGTPNTDVFAFHKPKRYLQYIPPRVFWDAVILCMYYMYCTVHIAEPESCQPAATAVAVGAEGKGKGKGTPCVVLLVLVGGVCVIWCVWCDGDLASFLS